MQKKSKNVIWCDSKEIKVITSKQIFLIPYTVDVILTFVFKKYNIFKYIFQYKKYLYNVIY